MTYPEMLKAVEKRLRFVDSHECFTAYDPCDTCLHTGAELVKWAQVMVNQARDSGLGLMTVELLSLAEALGFDTPPKQPLPTFDDVLGILKSDPEVGG